MPDEREGEVEPPQVGARGEDRVDGRVGERGLAQLEGTQVRELEVVFWVESGPQLRAGRVCLKNGCSISGSNSSSWGDTDPVWNPSNFQDFELLAVEQQ